VDSTTLQRIALHGYSAALQQSGQRNATAHEISGKYSGSRTAAAHAIEYSTESRARQQSVIVFLYTLGMLSTYLHTYTHIHIHIHMHMHAYIKMSQSSALPNLMSLPLALHHDLTSLLLTLSI